MRSGKLGTEGALVDFSVSERLPSVGYQDGTGHKEMGTGGFYWTGTLNRDLPSSAYNINFRGYDAEWSASRAYGFSVRPVR